MAWWRWPGVTKGEKEGEGLADDVVGLIVLGLVTGGIALAIALVSL